MHVPLVLLRVWVRIHGHAYLISSPALQLAALPPGGPSPLSELPLCLNFSWRFTSLLLLPMCLSPSPICVWKRCFVCVHSRLLVC